MKKILIIFLMILVIYSVFNLIFKDLITKNKIKVSKISRLFYTDDKTFIKTWEKRKERGKIGVLIYNYSDIIVLIFPVFLFWTNYSKEYRLTWFVLLFIYVMFIIFCMFSGPSRWSIAQDKYIQLKEKEKTENAEYSKLD
jgi:hypothetical protein